MNQEQFQSMRGKICLVTGAGKGIGQATALLLARTGATVCICDADQAAAEATRQALAADGLAGQAWVAVVDVTDQQAVSALISEIGEKHQRLDVLVHCAAIQEEAGFFATSAEKWRQVVDVNLFGTFCVCQAAALLMRDRAAGGDGCNGKIITLTSIHDSLPRLGKFAYDASKAGVTALTREMALALADARINVNAIAPGVIDTPMNQHLRDNPQAKEAAVSKVPWQRAGTAGEVARLALFLASDDADYITGAIIPIDGGRSLTSTVTTAPAKPALEAEAARAPSFWEKIRQKISKQR
jgi:NAD(P)-dependent dehydrogenase (short-subunit alcohol dehydrogenase family)